MQKKKQEKEKSLFSRNAYASHKSVFLVVINQMHLKKTKLFLSVFIGKKMD